MMATIHFSKKNNTKKNQQGGLENPPQIGVRCWINTVESSNIYIYIQYRSIYTYPKKLAIYIDIYIYKPTKKLSGCNIKEVQVCNFYWSCMAATNAAKNRRCARLPVATHSLPITTAWLLRSQDKGLEDAGWVTKNNVPKLREILIGNPFKDTTPVKTCVTCLTRKYTVLAWLRSASNLV